MKISIPFMAVLSLLCVHGRYMLDQFAAKLHPSPLLSGPVALEAGYNV